MVALPRLVSTVDYHTAGEPFRIVLGGVVPPHGATILDKRDDAIARLDAARVLLTHEPRGHADMYGCFLTEPDDDGADLGLVFFHREGFSTACGHGSIAAALWAYETGYVTPRPENTIILDVPSGRVTCRICDEGHGRPSVRFTNVPSYAFAQDVEVPTTRGVLPADIAYGGAFYAMVDLGRTGLRVTPSDLPALTALAAEVKHGIVRQHPLADPSDARIGGLYGVIFYERIRAEQGHVEERNVTVFADGQVDRSPCGSGTSARVATLAARGELSGGELVNHGIVNTTFLGRVTEHTTAHSRPAVIPEVEGTAHLVGYCTWVSSPEDELGAGFLLTPPSA